MKTLREYIDQLDEISRRDFLKGFGAAAGLVAVGAPQKVFGQDTLGSVPHVDLNKLKVLASPDINKFYPPKSFQENEYGEVVTRGFINSEGLVYKVDLLRSSGFPRLDRAAYDLSSKYKFAPVIINGNPVNVRTTFLIRFTLGDDIDETATPDAVARIEELVKYK
jgi:TonB family protein